MSPPATRDTVGNSYPSHALRFIDTLKALGCQFALDDLGTGLSSFSCLKALPADCPKIAGGFVNGLVGDDIDQAMWKLSIISAVSWVSRPLRSGWNRRRTIASYASNMNMRDPYPNPYTFTFRKDLAPGEVQTIYFVNPAARCVSKTTHFGTINVFGNN